MRILHIARSALMFLQFLLPILHDMTGTLSGDEKCEELGISRQSLWAWWMSGRVQPVGQAPGSRQIRWHRGDVTP